MASSSAGSVVTAVVVVLACISLVELVVRPLPSIKHRENEADEVVARPEQELAGFEEDLENDLLPKEERQQQQRRRRKEDEVAKDESVGGSDYDDDDDDEDDGFGDDEFDWSEADAYGTTREPIKERRMLTVKLCSSRATKSKFKNFREAMSNVSPGYDVRGSLYPPPSLNSFSAFAIRVAQSIGAVVALFGDIVFKALNMPHPGWYESLKAKKLMVIMGLWSGGNIIYDYVSSTGAFEVYYDGNLIWSTLQTKQIPMPEDISAAIRDLEETL